MSNRDTLYWQSAIYNTKNHNEVKCLPSVLESSFSFSLSLPPLLSICFQTEHHWFNKNMIQEQQIEMDVFPPFYYLCHLVIHSTHHTSKPNQSFVTLVLLLLCLIMVATSDYINLTWLRLRNSQLFCCVFSYHCYL